jgi:hypothetical protein
MLNTGAGGGIWNVGTGSVTNSTIAATGPNAAIENVGTLTVSNSTLSGNSIAIENASTMTVSNSTVSGNSAGGGGAVITIGGTLTLKGTLVAQTSGGPDCQVQSGTLTSDGYNLDDDGSCGFNQTGDQSDVTNAGSFLGPLQNNGGPTQTIALLPGSTAIDAIPVTPVNECTDALGNPVLTDQRGITRPQGSGCDIGAYELVPQLTASTSILNFGSRKIGGSHAMPVAVLNMGATNVTVGAATLTSTGGDPNAFSVHEYCEPKTLKPGKKCVIGVTFAPHETGLSTATLNIPSTAPDNPLEVLITGTGANKK